MIWRGGKGKRGGEGEGGILWRGKRQVLGVRSRIETPSYLQDGCSWEQGPALVSHFLTNQSIIQISSGCNPVRKNDKDD